MQYRNLGSTGLSVSILAFGCGPVSGLMTGEEREAQRTVVERALAAGINWFDTAAGYGAGLSEQSLGRSLEELDASGRVHVATKVRIAHERLDDIPGQIRASVAASLERLRLCSVTLLQLHNSVTVGRDDEPTSLTPADVLGPRGVLETFEQLKSEGVVRHLGLTGIGAPEALREVIDSGRFEAIQIPYHILNPSAGRRMPPHFDDTDYGNLIEDCARQGMGVMAIRVFAAGALLGEPPSAHTHKTPFFPLALYERDRARAASVARHLGERIAMKELALRFALSHPHVTSAIVGFGAPDHIDEAVRILQDGPVPADLLDEVQTMFEQLEGR